MKLRIPPLSIDESDPFKNLFSNRRLFGESLHRLLAESEDGFVLFVDGQWGQGKSTFINALRQYIKVSPLGEPPAPTEEARVSPDSVLFDAFAHDADEDPLVSFCAAIASFSKKLVPEPVHQDFLKKSVDVALSFGSAVSSKLIGTAAAAALAGHGADPSIAMGAGGSAEAGSKVLLDSARAGIAASLEGLDDFDDDEEKFSEQLECMASTYRNKTGFPLTVIVDELDRCSPAYALRLIERIKRFFEVNDICFLVFANVSQLERQIEKEYGAIDAANYLRKFADVRMNFPFNHVQGSRIGGSNAYQYAKKLKSSFSPSDGLYCEAWSWFEYFVNPLKLTLREVEVVARQLMLIEAAAGNSYASIIGPLAAIRTKDSSAYLRLKAMEMDRYEFFELLGVDPSVKLVHGLYDPVVELASIFLSKEEYNLVVTDLGDGGIRPRWQENSRYIEDAIDSLETFKL